MGSYISQFFSESDICLNLSGLCLSWFCLSFLLEFCLLKGVNRQNSAFVCELLSGVLPEFPLKLCTDCRDCFTQTHSFGFHLLLFSSLGQLISALSDLSHTRLLREQATRLLREQASWTLSRLGSLTLHSTDPMAP